MIGIFLFFSTTVWIGTPLLVGAFAIAIFRWSQQPKGAKRIKLNGTEMGFLVGFGILAVFNISANEVVIESFEKSILGAFPFLALLPVSFFISRCMTKLDLQVIAVLIAVETVSGALEYAMGTRSLFGATRLGMTEFGETNLMYFNRVYGMSKNSSAFAFKVLIFVLLTIPIGGRQQIWNFNTATKNKICFAISAGLVLVGLYVTFNRTLIIACGAHLCLVVAAFDLNRKMRVFVQCFFGLMVVSLMVLALDPELFEKTTTFISKQFNVSGRYTMEYSSRSGRGAVFAMFLEFLERNLWFGNASAKIWIMLNGRLFHAHNSFLMVLASNGILIGVPFLIGYFAIFCRRNRNVIAILLFSLVQYGVLWGLSANDILFFCFASGVAMLHDRQGVQGTRKQGRVPPIPFENVHRN